MFSRSNVAKFGLITTSALILTGCGTSPAAAPSGDPSAAQPHTGGDLVVASLPAQLDPFASTSRSDWMIAASVCEGLFANAANTTVSNGLAEDFSYDGNVTYVITLRDDVAFHSGGTLTATDVVASLDHYRGASAGKLFNDLVSAIEATGDHEVTITTAQPTGAIPALLATPDTSAYIMPASFLESTAGADLTTLDCTGAYKFDSFAADQSAVISRFDDYSSRSEPSDGAAGAKTAYADTITFVPFSDSNTLNLVRTGQVQIVPQFVSMDQYATYEADPGLVPVLNEGAGFSLLQFNLKEGLFTDLALRQAVQNAVDPEQIAMQQLGSAEYWVDDSSLFPTGSPWHSESGSDTYLGRDAKKAKSLLKAAGYDGTPVRILYRPDQDMYGPLLKQQLEAVGFTVDLQSMDKATFGSTRTDPAAWDIFLAGGTAYSDPLTVVFLNDDFPGWWVSEAKSNAMAAVTAGENDTARKPAWDTMQQLIWDELPFLKLGHEPRAGVVATTVGGYLPAQGTVRGFFNVWVTDQK